MRRRLFLVTCLGAVAVAAGISWHVRPTTAQQPTRPHNRAADSPADPLPITQVILFSSGVGYFQREGQVEESTRVDLSFPAGDVNDLLKSLVLQDQGGGKITSVRYDSHDPVDKTLKSFALDLTGNPTFGQILNQARGEKIEVTTQPPTGPQPNSCTGVIVGMESRVENMVEVHRLNLLCPQGMRSIPLAQVQAARFLNPALDAEFRQALAVLGSIHDTQKKTVSLGFSGEGKRTVRVGYVVENPIWKTSYRLLLEGKGRAFLQGWAVVENTSDDDWSNVRMVLVSGRPISFQMDLYQPLYVPRPTVEPELFASLRPPTHEGNIDRDKDDDKDEDRPAGGIGGMAGIGGGLAGLGGLGGLGGGMAGLGGGPGHNGYQNRGHAAGRVRGLTYEELEKRRKAQPEDKDEAGKIGSTLTAIDPRQGVAAAASARQLGDYFQYAIDHRVSLPRQKSALIPIVQQHVLAAKVSIFNEEVHAQYPLLGLRFKNTSGHHLMQGPVTVFDGGSYAGDTRFLDLQPNEERLLSYAIDLGTEVKAEEVTNPAEIVAVKIAKGVVHASHRQRRTKTYAIKNRSGQDRVLVIEHPYHADWKLVSPARANERSRDVYRFQVGVPAGKAFKEEVVEEKTRPEEFTLWSCDVDTLRSLFHNPVSSPRVKEALRKAFDLRNRLLDTQQELNELGEQPKKVEDDQARLRTHLTVMPRASMFYDRYLKKFDALEHDIEKLQGKVKQIEETRKWQTKEYHDYVDGLTVD
jgi:hypothetical protein